MKLLGVVVVLLFVGSLFTFLQRGLPAYAAAERAAASLRERVADLERTRREVSVVSHEDVAALLAERDQLAEMVGQRRALLVDGGLPTPPANLDALLDATRIPSLAPGSELRESVRAWAESEPFAREVLVALLDRLSAAQVEGLESLTPRHDGRPLPVEGVPGLALLALEVVVVCEVPDALALLESLVPGRGRPTFTLEGASLRRIEPPHWAGSSPRLTSPPVRLSLNLAVLFGVPTDDLDG